MLRLRSNYKQIRGSLRSEFKKTDLCVSFNVLHAGVGGGALQTQLRPAGLVHVIAGGSTGKHESDSTLHVARRRVTKKGRKGNGEETGHFRLLLFSNTKNKKRGRGAGEASTPAPPAVVRIWGLSKRGRRMCEQCFICDGPCLTERKEGRS